MSNCCEERISTNLRATIIADKRSPQRNKLRAKTHRFNTLELK